MKPALGYRIDFAGHFVVLSGDTRYPENLIRFSEGADVLIHEVIAPVRTLSSDENTSGISLGSATRGEN